MEKKYKDIVDLSNTILDYIYDNWRVWDRINRYHSLYDTKPTKDNIIWGIVYLSPQLSLAYYKNPSPCYEILVTEKNQEQLTWPTIAERSENDVKFIYDIENKTCRKIIINTGEEKLLNEDDKVLERLNKIISTLDSYSKIKNQILENLS